MIGDSLLAAEYLTTGLRYKEVYLDLDRCFGVDKGEFDRNRAGFSDRAGNVELIGSVLFADISGGTQRQASVDLKEIVQFLEDRAIVPRRNIEVEGLDSEILRY